MFNNVWTSCENPVVFLFLKNLPFEFFCLRKFFEMTYWFCHLSNMMLRSGGRKKKKEFSNMEPIICLHIMVSIPYFLFWIILKYLFYSFLKDILLYQIHWVPIILFLTLSDLSTIIYFHLFTSPCFTATTIVHHHFAL